MSFLVEGVLGWEADHLEIGPFLCVQWPVFESFQGFGDIILGVDAEVSYV
jgi:hypothetical protein